MGPRQGSRPLSTAYVDASAAVKLFRVEDETQALRAELKRWPSHVASELLVVEIRCTARRSGLVDEAQRAERVLSAIRLRPYGPDIRDDAGTMAFTPPLRALDAIHLATALSMRDDLAVLIAYDRDLLAAARAQGLTVASPA